MQLAAFLDRLTLRQIIALIPVVILILAYYHRIPIPPELMLVGDLLAYIDIFSLLILLGILSRAATVLFIIKQATARAASLRFFYHSRSRTSWTSQFTFTSGCRRKMPRKLQHKRLGRPATCRSCRLQQTALD